MLQLRLAGAITDLLRRTELLHQTLTHIKQLPVKLTLSIAHDLGKVSALALDS